MKGGRRSLQVYRRLRRIFPSAANASSSAFGASPFAMNYITAPTSRVVLDNKSCPYCGASLLQRSEWEKEHVIGRRFVPKGSLAKTWNLVVRSCRKCNENKGRLENDIPAITLLPSAAGKFAEDAEIIRKQTSISLWTGRPVRDSYESQTRNYVFSDVAKLSVTMISPPAISSERAMLLACMQISAFFYYLTYDRANCVGRYGPGEFVTVAINPRTDWGYPVAQHFYNTIKEWKLRLTLSNAANGFFQDFIKRHPQDEFVWAWALEWNKNYRLIGFFGQEDLCCKQEAALPDLVWKTIVKTSRYRERMRTEVRLNPEDESLLFQC